MFTDDCPFNLTGCYGRVYVWRKPGEEFLDACVVPKLKEWTVMVWGAIGFNGTGTLVAIDGKMKFAHYLELLEDQLPDNFAKLGLPLDFVLQQDNAPIHKANIVMDFLDENAIHTLDHPPKALTSTPLSMFGKKLLGNFEYRPHLRLETCN
ncbi:hypothetical protein AaE_004651 [Aphanomyces astaci]|uniref:Tc1-like transposase DDE domain-containing protein n=1 Tax=Aphanomyces astaci TaxID=112090 RepID=A0A6A5ALY2_APHAT|nr:hypothetical protein AaE_004651 [Aphanomyces astaci]